MTTIAPLVMTVLVILGTVSARFMPGKRGDCGPLGPGSGLRCRVTNQAGALLEEKPCPLGLPCTVGGRLEYYNGSTAAISYFCKVPIKSEPHVCHVLDSKNNTILENECPSGSTCTDGPQNAVFEGHDIQMYQCINPAEALPKLCSVVVKVCPASSYWDWWSWRCRSSSKYYFCGTYPAEGTTPPPETQFVCDVWGVRTGVSGSKCPSGETCSSEIPALLQDGTEVKALVCMLDSPRPDTYRRYPGGYHRRYSGGY